MFSPRWWWYCDWFSCWYQGAHFKLFWQSSWCFLYSFQRLCFRYWKDGPSSLVRGISCSPFRWFSNLEIKPAFLAHPWNKSPGPYCYHVEFSLLIGKYLVAKWLSQCANFSLRASSFSRVIQQLWCLYQRKPMIIVSQNFGLLLAVTPSTRLLLNCLRIGSSWFCLHSYLISVKLYSG